MVESLHSKSISVNGKSLHWYSVVADNTSVFGRSMDLELNDSPYIFLKENEMDVPDPRVRRRGYFVHIEPQSPDQDEHEAPEGPTIRLGSTRKPTHAIGVSSISSSKDSAEKPRGQHARSASATGSRRPLRTPR